MTSRDDRINESVEHLGNTWIFVSRNLKYVLKIHTGTSTISIQIPMKIDKDALDLKNRQWHEYNINSDTDENRQGCTGSKSKAIWM